MGGSMWAWLSIPILIVVLLLFSPELNFEKVGIIFWIISILTFLYGFCSGSLVLMYLAIIIIYLRASGKLGE